METRHPDCPDVHLGVCAKCRRLYERDALGMGDKQVQKDEPEMRGHRSAPAEDSFSASGVTASGASRRLRPRQRADDASLTKPVVESPERETEAACRPRRVTEGKDGGVRGPLTPAITIDDVRRKARERKRRWLERLKADPERYAEYLKRERARKR